MPAHTFPRPEDATSPEGAASPDDAAVLITVDERPLRLGMLVALIVAGDKLSHLDAVDIAGRCSISVVLDRLTYEVMDEHGEQVSAFLARWLEGLSPLERAEVARRVADQYTLAMVALPHSYGRGARLVLQTLAGALEQAAQMLGQVHWWAEGPDAQMHADSAGRVAALAVEAERVTAVLRAANQQLPSEVPTWEVAD